MAELFYKVFCLYCGADYIADMIEHAETCKKCGKPTEWEGFEV